MGHHPIEIQGLVKDYGSFRALHGVDLQVARGEAFGFIGPNGAGKSTTIRCLLDLLRPTAGVATVLGARDLANNPAIRARIGYLPGELVMTGRRTAREHLTYLATLRGGAGRERIEPLAERFGLALDRPVNGLSKGNKQKVGVIGAFMHAPELLILDEPTSGLDPLLQREFLALVRETAEAGATLFMSSHILSEVEAVAGRVAIIRAGRIVDVEDVRALRERAGQHVRLTFDAPLPAEAARAFAAIPELSALTIDGARLTALLRGSPDRLLKEAARHQVTRWSAEDRNLEELFMDHYRQTSADAGGEAC
ncbi:MAG: ABC transporter ATP-binding protein [Nannocystis sp.]|nr:ABC transporter ATP-binding protein [Nannocystis sp.]